MNRLRFVVIGLAVVVLATACAPNQPPVSAMGSPSPASAKPSSIASSSATEPVISLDPAAMDARYEAGLPLFQYDAPAQLDLERRPNAELDGLIIEDISYASPMGGDVPAFLISPASPGIYPGLILMHGSGGNRNDFLREGQAYARLGVIALLISAPPARRDPPGAFITLTPRDRDEQIQLIVDLRRGVDVLMEVGADPERIGYMGYSYGGAMGALLAGVEHRIRAYVIDVGDGGLVEHLTGSDDAQGDLADLNPAARDAWLAAMEPIEPLYFVRHAAPSALLFQSARNDTLVTTDDAERLHQQASEPKEIIWYDSGHGLPLEAWCDQAAWLREHLGFAEGPLLPGC